MSVASDFSYTVNRVKLKTGIEIAYIDEGQGPFALLLVHGLGSNLKSWQKLVEGLSPYFRCIAPDLPGYGWSSRGDYPFGMSFFAECLSEFIDQLELKAVVAVGHSMGAQISMTLALLAPEKVQALVLLAPAGFETFSEAEQDWLQGLFLPDLLMGLTSNQIQRNFELNFYQFPEDARFMVEDRLAMRQQPAEYEAFCRMIPQCVRGMLNEAVYDRLPEIAQPALVIFGADDFLIPNKILHPQLNTRMVAEAGAQRLPGSLLVLLPQCGHFLPWEGAGPIEGLIRSFLRPG